MLESSVPYYQPLHYTLRDVNITEALGIEPITRFDESLAADFKFSINNQIVELIDVPLLYKQIHRHVRMEGQCVRLFGFYDSELRHCETYHLLDKVCIKINQDEDGTWKLNSTETD